MQITREMIVGVRIVDVHSVSYTRNDLDFCTHYFTCEHGFSFRLPSAECRWNVEVIPDGAERAEDVVPFERYAVSRGSRGQFEFELKSRTIDDTIRRLKQSAVAGVLCGPLDPGLGFFEPWDTTILMEDGFRLSCLEVSDHGTGGAGLYYLPPDPELVARMTDYFSIPICED